MAESIKDRLGVETELVKGAGGIFDVTVDGELVYSKAKTGDFPDNDTLLRELEEMRSG